ncbi:MAG: thiosulfate oxidation carrier complex protein SoxZ [Gammaproteobacteria bacterium]|nr:thiosulfate oxidation carrier complex protein SoxZ [Gammaproteobacteria bacterium]
MASGTIKIKAALSGDITEVKALFQHDMETGQRKDAKTGEKIPAHHIKEVVCQHNGKTILTCDWGVAVAKNPYLSFRFGGAKVGDSVKIQWTDNKGDSDSAETKIG